MRQKLGSFEVIGANRIAMQVTVSQEINVDIHGVVIEHRKVFTLGDSTGEELIPTDDPKILRKQDGSRLKRIGLNGVG